MRLVKQLIYLLVLIPVLVSGQSSDSIVIREIDSLLELSIDFAENQEFEKAFELNAMAEKLALSKFSNASVSFANSLLNKGKIYYYKSEFVDAEKWFLQSKPIFENTLGKGSSDYAMNLHMLGVINYMTGNYNKAEQYYLESRAIREEIFGKSSVDYAASILNLGLVYTDSGNYEKAEPLYLETKEIFEAKLKNMEHPLYLNCLNNLGILYYQMGMYNKAEPLGLEAKRIRERNLGKEHPEYAQSLNNLSVLYTAMGNYEKAEPFALEAKTIFKKVYGIEHPHYASSVSSLANLYYYKGNFEKALNLELEAREINEKVYGKVHPECALIINNLGNTYMDLRQMDKAEVCYLESMRIYEKVHGKDHPDYAWSLGNLANFYLANGQFEKAESFALEVKKLREKLLGKQHPHYLDVLYTLAYVYEIKKEYQIGERILEEAASLEQAQVSSAISYLSEQELAKYIDMYKRNGSDMANYTLACKESGGNCNKLTELVFNNALFYKGFLLKASSRMNVLASTNSLATDIYKKLKGYRRRLASEYSLPISERTNLLELEDKANAAEKELSSLISEYEAESKQLSWKDIQSKLTENEVAIEFLHLPIQFPHKSGKIIYIALILKSGIQQIEFIPLFYEESLDSLLQSNTLRRADYVNNLYTHFDRGAIAPEESKRTLYDILWRPLVKELTNVKTIYFSPSGLLHRINLDAIPISETETLADRYQLIGINSTRQLAIPSQIKNNRNDAVLFGGIQFEQDSTIKAEENLLASRSMEELAFSSVDSTLRGGSWNYLPGTEREVNAIEKIMQSNELTVDLKKGYLATEENFKNIGTNNTPSPRILHIATHGYFFADPKTNSQQSLFNNQTGSVFKMSEHPMLRSGLILAGGNAAWQGKQTLEGREDGILTAYEISQMNLSNTELVVLSACETGLGDIQGNEGVYGLQRAFKIAGAKYLIMSLWQVPDKQTSMLMTTFYKKLLELKMTIPDAFHAAQKELRELGLDPYQWAGFVLVE
ncbi:MAG: CHAT domain-containing tetratricopeptide repeat protein [Saprospiraceae bacterium]|jgi:CHAT domain-containing protein